MNFAYNSTQLRPFEILLCEVVMTTRWGNLTDIDRYGCDKVGFGLDAHVCLSMSINMFLWDIKGTEFSLSKLMIEFFTFYFS